MDILINTLVDLSQKSGFAQIFTEGGWKIIVMILISCVLIYLAIAKQFEPLLLLPIAFGMLLTNLPGGGLFHPELFNPKMVDGVVQSIDYGQVLHNGGLLDILYLGVKLGIYPPLIFLGIGAMTDFAPLISNPKSFLLGAAAQAGIFFTFIVAAFLPMYTLAEAGGIAIIGGADGPTSILVASRLAPHLLGSIAIAAYSYMALVPVIQPPIMKALTTKKERSVVMKPLRPVSKTEKILFPIIVTMLVIMLVPDTAPLIGMLMFGNLLKESGVAKRLVQTATNELMNIITIFLGVTVGATATANTFLDVKTLGIIMLGLIAFCIGSASGVLFGKLMYLFTKGKVNPLIGSAGVSAVPMAARVSQKVGSETNNTNFLLMHAMGPNVAGVIGSAIAAGVLLSVPLG
ncbi:MAG: sodium ion-translocating decarboxylase subunit beta [Oscillospiraceae bacterium]|nr:sodium ion-translocating decarboxylase subunit beta [Oscillospiraceae bacterium]